MKKEIKWRTGKELENELAELSCFLDDSGSRPSAKSVARDLLFEKARDIYKKLPDEEKRECGLTEGDFMLENEVNLGWSRGYTNIKVKPWDERQFRGMVRIILSDTCNRSISRMSYGGLCHVVGFLMGHRVTRHGAGGEFKAKLNYVLKEGNEYFKNIIIGAVELALTDFKFNRQPVKLGGSLDDPKAVWEELRKPAVIVDINEGRRAKKDGAR